ncbi:Bifunctional thiamine biosynthesis protein ThiDN [ANME-1 cluster archaeon GoMg3.2]|nr:Bifunctional thiamine biosynthesis protein ThiDN [ANME-1 cluster archaeon GoMg3.2]
MAIGGSDCSGGAGIQADIKTFSALGVHGTSVLTAITAQNSEGVQAIQEVPVKIVEQQLESIMSDIAVDYAKTGMLYSAEIIAVAATQLKRYNVPFVLDPVMNAGAGGILLEDNALNTLIELLLPICTVVTPNVPEASRISGLKIRDIEDAKLAALKINDMGATAVIIKGGHLEHEIAAGKATDLIYDGEFEHISTSMIKQGKIVHGAGCTFSAALAAELAKGTNLHDAATSAKKFVYNAIIGGVELPNLIVVNQSLRKDADRYFVLENVKEAVTMLKETPNFKNHIPEVGTNIGMAIADAKSEHDVAAVDGRIITAKEGVHAGCVDFDVSSHVARLVLTMMKHDKTKRSAINVKYTSELIEACEELGLTVSSFDRAKEPAGAKTMDWGVREASVVFSPDVVYDLGAVGKEPMVRIFGNTAVEVASKVKGIMAVL